MRQRRHQHGEQQHAAAKASNTGASIRSCRQKRSSAATGTARHSATVTTVTIRPYLVNSQKLMRLAGAFGDAEDDDVGRGADGGGVAAEVGAERQRPPQHLRLVAVAVGVDQLGDDRAHRGHVRDVVDDRGQDGRAPQQHHRGEQQPALDGVGGGAGDAAR